MLNQMMTPETLASLHPRLYHITRAQALPSIWRHGLLSTHQLLNLFDVPAPRSDDLLLQRRPTSIVITHPTHGSASLTDNLPLKFSALANCLDDGLRPEDWMRLLNVRVFFWVDERHLLTHLRATVRDGVPRIVLTLDTLSVVRSHYEHVELSAINSGSTLRKPARRGLTTFSPAQQYSYSQWQKLRGRRDRIKELTVLGAVQNIERHLIDHRAVPTF